MPSSETFSFAKGTGRHGLVDDSVECMLQYSVRQQAGITVSKKRIFTPAQRRFVWLLETLYGGNRAAMSRATGVSMTGIVKIVTGQQDAGRRVLEKITANTEVNPAWLLTGEGPPLRGSGLPVAAACLPGPPALHPELFSGEKIAQVDDLYSPTRYWLKVDPNEWATRPNSEKLTSYTNLWEDGKLNGGDLLLMESDRLKFPPIHGLHDRWCAVQAKGRKVGLVGLVQLVRLARLAYTASCSDSEPEYLEAETFAKAVPKVRRTVFDEYSDGGTRVTRSQFTPEEPPLSPGARTPPQYPPDSRAVKYRDVVGVCVLLVRRFD